MLLTIIFGFRLWFTRWWLFWGIAMLPWKLLLGWMKLPPEPMFDDVFFLLAILPELEVIGLPDYDVYTKVLFCYIRIFPKPLLLRPPWNEFILLFPLYIILSVWVLLVSPLALFLLFPPIPMLFDCCAYLMKLLYWELKPGWFILPVDGCLGCAF
jgi:hypothetical protein